MATPPTPPPVRAVARVGATPQQAGPWRLSRYRARQRVGRFRVEQLVVVELVLLGVLTLLHRPLWQVVTGGVVGLVVMSAVFASTGGRWWLARVAMRGRFRRRRAAARTGRAKDQRLAVLRELSPALTVESAEERDHRIGIGYDGSGWFAVAELDFGSRNGVVGEHAGALPFGNLARTVLDDEFPVSTIQVVTHTVPAPSAGLSGQAACQASYRELVSTVHSAAAAFQTLWLTVRLDADDALAAAEERGGGTDGVHRAIAAALSRCTKAVEGRGRTCRLLDADELLDALVRSCGITGTGTSPGRNRTTEEWDLWRGDGLAHAGYWIETWPPVEADRHGLLTDLIVTCGVENSLSIALRRPPLAADGAAEPMIDIHGVLRLMTVSDGLARAGEQAVDIAKRSGFGLSLLSGEQAPAIFASAPTGLAR
ncbi:MAG: type VII secretion protein EccE [Actinocatenispora sp.]